MLLIFLCVREAVEDVDTVLQNGLHLALCRLVLGLVVYALPRTVDHALTIDYTPSITRGSCRSDLYGVDCCLNI